MNRIIYSVIIGLLFAASAFSQSASEEIAKLKKHLELPDSYSITQGDGAFTDQSPVKIYVAVGLNASIKKNLDRWFTDWNGGKGKKFGTFQIVPDLDTADVVLAGYQILDNIQIVTESSSRVVAGTAWDPAKNTTVTAPVARTSSRSTSVAPTFSYILVKTKAGLEILQRRVYTARIYESDQDGMAWRNDLYAMMKARKKKGN